MKDREVKKILKTDLEIPEVVEDKMKESYQMLGIRTGRRTTVKTYRKLVTVAAAAAMLAATSLAALAANGFFTKEVVEQDQKLSYQFEMNYELTPYAVEAIPGYIPEGYTEFENGKYDRDGQHKNGISICEINAAWLAEQPEALDVAELKSLDKTTLNGMEAHLLTLNFDSERTQYGFDKRIYLFNPTDGYIIEIFGGNDISMEELKKVGENLEITVDQSTPVNYTPQSEIADQEEAGLEVEERYRQMYLAGVEESSILQAGDTFRKEDIYGKEVDYTILDTKVADNISEIEGYDARNFFSYEDVQPWILEDGTLKSYERITYQKSEDGTVDQNSGVTETAQQKFLILKGKMKNNGSEAAEGWACGTITNLVPKADGTFAYHNIWSEPYDLDSHQFADGPLYFDQSQYRDEPEENRSHFFYYNLQPGEEISYTLVWMADADRLDNAFVEMNYSGMDDGSSLYVEVNP